MNKSELKVLTEKEPILSACTQGLGLRVYTLFIVIPEYVQFSVSAHLRLSILCNTISPSLQNLVVETFFSADIAPHFLASRLDIHCHLDMVRLRVVY